MKPKQEIHCILKKQIFKYLKYNNINKTIIN